MLSAVPTIFRSYPNTFSTLETCFRVADFLTSAITAYMPFGQLNTPTSSAGPVRGTHEMGDPQPLPTCSRFLLGFQIFTWNVACVGSLVVVVVFWFSLVRIGLSRCVCFVAECCCQSDGELLRCCQLFYAIPAGMPWRW